MCGIFGVINSSKRTFDYKTFCTLGICNDERGGDSCGIFIDGKYEYGVNDKKLFVNFYRSSKILNTITKSRIALGHCRKASVGAIDVTTAQPVIIEENGVVKFVVLHNGTIFNYEDLAKKYIPEVDIKNMTDSQVMARIFYNCGYNVLKEYIGSGAFVIADYREEEPQILMFKGASLMELNAAAPSEERPLFLTFSDKKVTFSSISRYLLIDKKADAVYTLKENTLLKLDNDCELIIVATYDRSKCYQLKTVWNNYDEYTNYFNHDYYNNNHKHNNDYHEGNKNTNPIALPAVTKQTGGTYEFKYICSNDDGTYSVGGVLLHGFYFINNYGKIISRNDKKEIKVHIFFFWQGVMLYNKECYKFLKKMCKVYGITEGQLMEDYPLLVHSLSPDPFRDDQLFEGSTATCVALSWQDFEVIQNEQWQYFMSKNSYWFDESGNIAGSWDSQYSTVSGTFDDYVRLCDKKEIDFSVLIDEFKLY